MSKTMWDFICESIEAEKHKITLEEFSDIMRSGTPEEKEDAVARMEEAGGYENLE